MNHTKIGPPSAVAAALAATLISLCPVTSALAADVAKAPAAGAALVGGALPGGAVISARSVAVAPVAGGPTTAVPITADGSFSAAGLAPGPYRLAVTSVTVPRQTQGATFGEKVNAGLHAAGSAISQGASLVGGTSPGGAKHDTAKNSVGNVRAREAGVPADDAADTATGQAARASDSMPSRISMNVTVGKQTQRAIVDDSVIAVEVGTDGTLSGRVAAP
jgi:hypothetical protein